MKWFKKDKPPLRQPHLNNEGDGIAFRRSRTLTGSASSNVSASNESRSQLKSPRLKEHELKKHRRLLGSGLFGVLALIAGCIWLLDQYIVTVDTIQSSQSLNRSLAVDRYQSAVKEYLTDRPLERFRFNLRQDQLSEYVRQARPEVASIVLKDGNGLVNTEADISLRVPVAVWQIEQEKYYVDADGETFSQNYFREPGVSVKDESGIPPEVSGQIASSRLLRFLGKTVAEFNEPGVGTVVQVIIPGGSLRQLDVTLNSHPYRIKTHMDRDPVGQVADAVTAIRHLDRNQVQPEYLDVRVSGKAFYR